MQAEDYFNKLVKEFPDGTPGKMFGALCMKMPNGKAAAMFWREALIVKLPEKLRNEALSLDGAGLFDPAGGRPMKEWVLIPFDYKDKWKNYMRTSAKLTNEIAVEKKPKSAVKSKVAKKVAKKKK